MRLQHSGATRNELVCLTQNFAPKTIRLQAFVLADEDKSGGIDFDEFVLLYSKVKKGTVSGLSRSSVVLYESPIKASEVPGPGIRLRGAGSRSGGAWG